jgi:SPP1 family predicted phage head-tail adaptor
MTDAIGHMRHRLTLEQPVATPDGGGGNTLTWMPVANLWGSLRPVSANEVPQGDGLRGRVTHEIVIRHRAGVTGAMRFAMGPRAFAIRSAIDPDERGAWLRCLTEETTP